MNHCVQMQGYGIPPFLFLFFVFLHCSGQRAKLFLDRLIQIKPVLGHSSVREVWNVSAQVILLEKHFDDE